MTGFFLVSARGASEQPRSVFDLTGGFRFELKLLGIVAMVSVNSCPFDDLNFCSSGFANSDGFIAVFRGKGNPAAVVGRMLALILRPFPVFMDLLHRFS